MIGIAFLVEWALRSFLLIGSGALLLGALRVKDPSARWAAWTAMLCASLVIPALTVALPKVPLPFLRVALVRVEAPTLVHHPALEPAPIVPRPDKEIGEHISSVSPPSNPNPASLHTGHEVERHGASVAKRLSWAGAAAVIYVLVALALLLRLSFGLAMSRRLLRNSRLTDQAFEGIEIRESDRLATPAVLGIVRMVIVLPWGWREWDSRKLHAVLAHESSHIRRHDPAVQLLSAVHRGLLWHNPLSWLLHGRIVQAAEEASDDAALAITGDRPFYAEMLLDFIQHGVWAPIWQGVPVARYGRAEDRINRILDGTALSRGLTLGVLTAILALGLPLAYLAAAAHPQSAPQAPSPSLSHPMSNAAIPAAVEVANVAPTGNEATVTLLVDTAEGCTKIANFLPNQNADLGARDEYGATPLMLAAHYCNADAVKLLLDKGADVEARDKYDSTALLLAAAEGKADVMKELLDHGAQIDDRDQYGSTPLLRAAFGGHGDVVKLLLDRGADLEAQDKGRRTALTIALQQRNTEIAELLLERGAKVDVPGSRSPLLLATQENMPEVVKLLLDRGANPEVVGDNGAMPLTVAISSGNVEMVKLFLNKGVHLADYGSTVMFARPFDLEMLTFLLDNGANVDARDINGNGDTLLIETVRMDKIEVMKLLLDHGADIEAKDNGGMTALMWAAFWGKTDIAKLLLDRGAKLNATNDHGQTALSFALSGPVKNPEVLNLLREKGAQ